MKVLLLVVVALIGCRQAPPAVSSSTTVRFATFNVSLHRDAAGGLVSDLKSPGNQQAQQIAEIIQRARPDVILLNEFDYDPDGEAARLFQENYLAVSQGGQPPIRFEHQFTGPVNTGVPTGRDLDRDGQSDGPGDAFGFGQYPGQYGMLVLSQLPIEHERVRTFQKFLWSDMPGAAAPIDPESGEPYYAAQAWRMLRLSSKSHWDVPIDVDGTTIHFLVAHPTPPAFDGPEDRNGCRNHDEIRFWADYIDPATAGFIDDDEGMSGGLPEGARFVIAGDLNADPVDGGSRPGAIGQLLKHRLIDAANSPSSRGGREAAERQGGANDAHRGDPSLDTADFSDAQVGNLRVDYVLPSRTPSVLNRGIFWPVQDDVSAILAQASDHRLVWLDLER